LQLPVQLANPIIVSKLVTWERPAQLEHRWQNRLHNGIWMNLPQIADICR